MLIKSGKNLKPEQTSVTFVKKGGQIIEPVMNVEWAPLILLIRVRLYAV